MALGKPSLPCCSRTMRTTVVLLAVAALAIPANAFFLPIILPPNLSWYSGYTSSPVLPLPLPRPQQIPPVANYLGYPGAGLGGGLGGLGGYGGGYGGIPGGIRPGVG